MHLDGHRGNAVPIEGFEGIQEGYRNDRGFGFDGAFEAAALEVTHLVTPPGSGSFRENQVIAAVFDLLGQRPELPAGTGARPPGP